MENTELYWHFVYNVYPPISAENVDKAIEVALDALERARNGLWDDPIDARLPDHTVGDFLEDYQLVELV